MTHKDLTRVGNEFRSIRAGAERAAKVVGQVAEAAVAGAVVAGERAAQLAEPYLPQDPRRRALLKYSLFGASAFMLGKILGPSLTMFPQDVELGSKDKEYFFKNFRVVEKDGELGFYDKLGNEILVLQNNDDDTDTPAGHLPA